MLLHHGSGTGCVNGSSFGRIIELAPGRALAVEQLFPAHGLHPPGQTLGGNALLLEVVKLVSNTLLTEPAACFLDSVAVGDAVDGGDLAHGVRYR
ncbi:hypothetical protein SDC9_212065 [bioreactor metagenome]|uniref:Uncharacterized protein n=1 Tax=bioreactor metagenome TaxID=1076179 RepID=A0A645JXI4_9ZZZZ